MLRIQEIASQCVSTLGLSTLVLVGCGEAVGVHKAIVHASVDSPAIQVAIANPANPANPSGGKATPTARTDSASAAIRRVTLSAQASKRLGIQFADVTAGASASDSGAELPYNALLYDASGGEWVFVSPAPNIYMRTAVKVERIDGDKVIVSKGPAAGSKVVTMGAAELYGIEFGVGK